MFLAMDGACPGAQSLPIELSYVGRPWLAWGGSLQRLQRPPRVTQSIERTTNSGHDTIPSRCMACTERGAESRRGGNAQGVCEGTR